MEVSVKKLNKVRIALVVPPLARASLYGEWDLSSVDSISPPLGLLSIAANIRKYGGAPTIHDAYARKLSLDRTIEEVLACSPDVIGVSCMTPSYPDAKILIQQLKKNVPHIPIILGGAHMSALGVEVMTDLPELDYGVVNEGEITIIELLDAIGKNDGFAEVDGVIYRSNGSILKTKPRDFIADLDILPYPAWDLLPSLIGDYKLSIIGTKGSKATSLITSRGCPARCTFCDTGGVGAKIRGFSANYVIGMLEHLIERYGVTDFLFYDDTFAALKPRVKEICETIIEKKMNIHWSCCSRVDLVNPEMLRLMRKAGCWQLEYGIESGSQKIINSMAKHITLEKVEKALRWTKEAGIETRGNFIFGYFGETKDTLEETIRYALKVDLDYFQQSFLTPFPGSEIYFLADQYGQFDKDLEKMNNLTINFVPHGFTKEELERYSIKAFRAFYFRPKIIFFHLKKIKSFHDLLKLGAAFFAFIKSIFRKNFSGVVSPA